MLCYYCWVWGGGSDYLFRFSRPFSLNVLKEFHKDIESFHNGLFIRTVEARVLSEELSVP